MMNHISEYPSYVAASEYEWPTWKNEPITLPISGQKTQKKNPEKEIIYCIFSFCDEKK